MANKLDRQTIQAYIHILNIGIMLGEITPKQAKKELKKFIKGK